MWISLVNNVIEQVASGENFLNIIASKIREKDTTVLYSLEKLMDIGLVEENDRFKEHPSFWKVCVENGMLTIR